ncbi:MAG: response regulator [Nitrospirota bacterium]
MSSPYRILVVDDEEKIRKSLSGLLQDYDYEVATASSGPECLQIMSSQTFDLVILDIVMPGMDGIEVLQKIKEEYKDTEVIIITGYADKEKAIATFRLGVYDFIEKPFESKEILNTIAHCLNQLELKKEIEKKTMELAVEKERLLVTLRSIGDGVIATDREGKILLINKVAEELTGWTQQEAAGKPHYEIFHIINEKTRKIPEDPVTRVITTGLIVGLANHTILIARDGTERIIADSGAPIKDRDGNIIGVVLVFRDITEHRKAEKELRMSEEKYRTLFEESKDAVFISTPEGRFLDINPSGVELLGYSSKDELLRIDIAQDLYFNPQDREKYQQALKQHGFVKDYELVLKKKDGKRLIVLATTTAVHDEKGNIVSYRGMMRDVTDQRRLESQLLQAQKMEAVGTLTGGIAHEFNNMLTTIIGYGKLLQEEMVEDDPLKHNVEMILVSSERAANLIQSLLAFSREQIIKPMPVSLNEIIKKVEKLLLRVIGEDVELKVILNPPTPPFDKGGQGGIEDVVVMADQGQIEQVLVNLATNARDAMPDGGCLTISTELVELDEEFLSAFKYKKPGRYALISVTDTGTGMDKKIVKKIFEPFFTTKEVGRGTGLGLSMVYGIIKQHNGYINVNSESGKGTTFKIYLPVIKSYVEEIKPSTVTIPTGGTETILLVEDDLEVRKLTKDILQKFGYKVLEAVDGEDAIKKFIEDKDKIQLLILDVVMPKKSGKEAYDEIKKIRHDIKALFVSGYAVDIVRRKGFLDEEFDFISKPLSPKELLRKVREVLDK